MCSLVNVSALRGLSYLEKNWIGGKVRKDADMVRSWSYVKFRAKGKNVGLVIPITCNFGPYLVITFVHGQGVSLLMGTLEQCWFLEPDVVQF